MSQKETTATIGRHDIGESQYGNLSELTELAREAFEQKRTKDCLDLTRAMLLVDPGNADAQSMRLSIQSEMHRDLDNARAFIRQAQSRESLEPQLQPGATETEGRVPIETEAETGNSRTGKLVSGAVRLLTGSIHSRRVKGVRWLLVASGLIAVGVVLASLPRFRTAKRPVEPSLMAMNSSDVPKPVVTEDIPPAQVETLSRSRTGAASSSIKDCGTGSDAGTASSRCSARPAGSLPVPESSQSVLRAPSTSMKMMPTSGPCRSPSSFLLENTHSNTATAVCGRF